MQRICTVLILLLYPLTCFSAGWEYYLEPKVKAPIHDGFCLNVKEEMRFKEGINYYNKNFGGISKRLNRDIDFSLYIALVLDKKTQKWETTYLIWPELALKYRLRKCELISNTKLEYIFTLKTWNFRNQVAISFPINSKLSFWVGDEPRLLSLFEKAYLGENEILTGVVCDFKIRKIFSSLNMFYDLRSKKNKNWQNTNCIRLAVNLTF